MKITIAILLGVCAYFGFKSYGHDKQVSQLKEESDLNWQWYQYQLKISDQRMYKIAELETALDNSKKERLKLEKSTDKEVYGWTVLSEVKVGHRKIQVRSNH